MAQVLSINISIGGIPKLPISSCAVTSMGLANDGREHSKHAIVERAISLFDVEIMNQLNTEGYVLVPGAIGENITVENLDVQTLESGDRLCFTGGVVIELTEARKPCFVLDPLGISLKKDIVGRCGYLAKVITEGIFYVGDEIVVSKVTT